VSNATEEPVKEYSRKTILQLLETDIVTLMLVAPEELERT
jgi:hypothetical protein